MNKWISAKGILYGSIAVLLLGIVLLSFFKPTKKEKPLPPEAALPVSVVTAKKTDQEDLVMLPALLEARIDATLAAEKAGRVVKIFVDRGDPVQKKQLLLQIDDHTERAILTRAKIIARDAKKNFERFERLKKAGAVADSEYDQVEKETIVSAARLNEVNISIKKCQVHSPENGIVNDRFIDVGEYVLPGTPLFQVIDSDSIKVILQIPEKDIFAIKVGDKLSFKIQSIADKTFFGVVSFVAVQADVQNNSFRAELSISNKKGLLRPGMIARVLFRRGVKKQIISLPISAVLPSKGDHVVYIVKEGHVIRRKVKIASLALTNALISKGLNTGDVVVIDGNRTLTDGQRVRIVKQEIKK